MNATQTETVTFYAKCHNQRLVRESKRRMGIEAGEPTDGVRYEFVEHKLVTDDADLIEWLRNHPRFNELFWEYGKAPDAVLPLLEHVLQEIGKAAAQGNSARLVEIYELENSSHQREAVLGAAKAALDELPDEPEVEQVVDEGEPQNDVEPLPVPAGAEQEPPPEAA